MRILLLTDSLGCPREEISVSETWTDQLLFRWSKENVVYYTCCKHGLSVKDIDINYIKEISPDVIVMQVGIVDACRRALTRKEINCVSHIRGFSRFIKSFCNKYHYGITKFRNVHYCSLRLFNQIICQIKDELNSAIVFISIAPPGKNLVNKVFRIEADIDDYNTIIKMNSDIVYLDPYADKDPDSILLADGHHLNDKGHDVVFHAVDQTLRELIEGGNKNE